MTMLVINIFLVTFDFSLYDYKNDDDGSGGNIDCINGINWW